MCGIFGSLPLSPWADPRAIWKYHETHHYYALEDYRHLCCNERERRVWCLLGMRGPGSERLSRPDL